MADLSDNRPMNGQMDGGLADESRLLEEAKKELEAWKAKVEKADDVKARLILENLGADEAKKKAQQEMFVCVKKEEESQREFTQSLNAVQDEIRKLGKCKQDLLDILKKYRANLEAKRVESDKLKQKFKICVQIADTEIKFSGQNKEEQEDDGQTDQIRGVFAISQRPSVLLQGGQALITFEEETVASQILRIAKCSVSCDNQSVDVKPKAITLDPTVKFEVHLDVSRKDLNVSNVPPSMSDERMKDRLEMSFSRPSRGGGEVESVEYNKTTGTGRITFLHPGVAESLALRGSYLVDLDSQVKVRVGPVCKHQLRKFQTFCGAPKRTVLLDGIKDIGEEEDVQDHLEIHFQKPSNCGGEIDSIKYISRGKALQAFFVCEDTDQKDK
ncbi:N-myc-interactor [Symphorus nematophorus]